MTGKGYPPQKTARTSWGILGVLRPNGLLRSALALLLVLCVALPAWAEGYRLTNGGDAAVKYNVVVAYTSAANSFTTTSTAKADNVIGVLWEATANGATGLVVLPGSFAKVKLASSVSIGDYLVTTTTAGKAGAAATGDMSGVFAIALQAGVLNDNINCIMIRPNSIGAGTTLSLTALTASGAIQGSSVTATGGLVGDTLAVGGGYGSSGLSVTAAGQLNADGGGLFAGAVQGSAVISTGAVSAYGGTLDTTATTGNLFNANATTLNLGGAATTITFGATTGTMTLRNADVNLLGDLAVYGGDIPSTATTMNVFNATSTTVNAFGAATALTLGATTGTATIRNATTALTGDLNVGGGDITNTAGAITITAGAAAGMTLDAPSGNYTLAGLLNGAPATFMGSSSNTADAYFDYKSDSGTRAGETNFRFWAKGSATAYGAFATDSVNSAFLIDTHANLPTIKITPSHVTELTIGATDIAVGSASTDTMTMTSRILVRSVTDAGPMTATAGTQREIVFNTSNSTFYGCSVTHASAATWVALN